MPDLDVSNLEIAFGQGHARTPALRGACFSIRKNSSALITGPSGSGKTTLLTVIGALLVPDSGDVFVDGQSLRRLSDRGRSAFRKAQIGFVFQAFRLMESLTAEDNVRLSLSMRGLNHARERARSTLEAVGLKDKGRLYPRALSGGEKQRVAVARALAHDPILVLADEPTASLDAENGRNISQLLTGAARARDRTVLIVSHDQRIKPFVDQVVRMEDGLVIGVAS